MRPSEPLEFPGGRHVAGWWKQLAAHRPRTLWVAHVLLHRVEARVRTCRPVRPDAFTRLVLEACAPGETTPDLASRLGVGRQMATRVLRQFEVEGLVRDDPDGGWGLTALGRQALEEDGYARPMHERRVFSFVENEAGRPPHFLDLPPQAGTPWSARADWTFDVSLLRGCVHSLPAWKERHGFPQDVVEVADSQEVAAVRPWQSVILDRAEYLAAAVVLVPADQGDKLLGYTVDPAGWGLHARQPVFSVLADWQEVLPDLAAGPTPEQWHEAWQGWCQRRGLPTVEADACVLERQDHLVRVRAPGRLLDRLRTARSEALKGEAWLLAGTGRVRQAAQVEVYS